MIDIIDSELGLKTEGINTFFASSPFCSGSTTHIPTSTVISMHILSKLWCWLVFFASRSSQSLSCWKIHSLQLDLKLLLMYVKQ